MIKNAPHNVMNNMPGSYSHVRASSPQSANFEGLAVHAAPGTLFPPVYTVQDSLGIPSSIEHFIPTCAAPPPPPDPASASSEPALPSAPSIVGSIIGPSPTETSGPAYGSQVAPSYLPFVPCPAQPHPPLSDYDFQYTPYLPAPENGPTGSGNGLASYDTTYDTSHQSTLPTPLPVPEYDTGADLLGPVPMGDGTFAFDLSHVVQHQPPIKGAVPSSGIQGPSPAGHAVTPAGEATVVEPAIEYTTAQDSAASTFTSLLTPMKESTAQFTSPDSTYPCLHSGRKAPPPLIKIDDTAGYTYPFSATTAPGIAVGSMPITPLTPMPTAGWSSHAASNIYPTPGGSPNGSFSSQFGAWAIINKEEEIAKQDQAGQHYYSLSSPTDSLYPNALGYIPVPPWTAVPGYYGLPYSYVGSADCHHRPYPESGSVTYAAPVQDPYYVLPFVPRAHYPTERHCSYSRPSTSTSLPTPTELSPHTFRQLQTMDDTEKPRRSLRIDGDHPSVAGAVEPKRKKSKTKSELRSSSNAFDQLPPLPATSLPIRHAKPQAASTYDQSATLIGEDLVVSSGEVPGDDKRWIRCKDGQTRRIIWTSAAHSVGEHVFRQCSNCKIRREDSWKLCADKHDQLVCNQCSLWERYNGTKRPVFTDRLYRQTKRKRTCVSLEQTVATRLREPSGRLGVPSLAFPY